MALRFLTNTSRLSRSFPSSIYGAAVATSNYATPAGQSARQHHDDDPAVNNEPIKFFGSQAAAWRAKSSRSGGADDHLWYQPYVISASLTVFLVYFCILREENDVDQKLGRSLFDHIDGLEETQLVVMYKYNRDNGLDNSEIVARLKELNVDIKSIVG